LWYFQATSRQCSSCISSVDSSRIPSLEGDTLGVRCSLRMNVDSVRDGQLLLGLPLYGYVSQSTKQVVTDNLLPSSMVLLQQNEVTSAQGTPDLHFLNVHARSKENHDQNLTVAAMDANLTSWYGQQIPFANIVKAGALVKASDGTYKSSGGFTRGELSLNGFLVSSAI
jgi:hypothetical protein